MSDANNDRLEAQRELKTAEGSLEDEEKKLETAQAKLEKAVEDKNADMVAILKEQLIRLDVSIARHDATVKAKRDRLTRLETQHAPAQDHSVAPAIAALGKQFEKVMTTVVGTVKNLETLLTSSHSSASSRRPGAGASKKDQCLHRDGHKCRVSGQQRDLISAHIAARRYAEAIGVDTGVIDTPANKIALLDILEKTLDTFEWTFDGNGDATLLYPLSKAKVLLEKNEMKVQLVPEEEGGPSREIIEKAKAFALKQMALRCPDCWVPRIVADDLHRHRKHSCPHRGSWEGENEEGENEHGAVRVDHFWVSGEVRGVGFREAVKALADNLNVVGMIRNVGSARVEMVCQGHPDSLDELRLLWEDKYSVQSVEVGPEVALDMPGEFRVTVDAKDPGLRHGASQSGSSSSKGKGDSGHRRGGGGRSSGSSSKGDTQKWRGGRRGRSGGSQGNTGDVTSGRARGGGDGGGGGRGKEGGRGGSKGSGGRKGGRDTASGLVRGGGDGGGGGRGKEGGRTLLG